MKKLRLHCACLLLMMVSSNTQAVDGVVEINHTCATQLGCFSGDPINYPVVIDGSAGSSYRLTSNLIVPTVSTSGIRVDASNISIDLNGFEIIGIACVGATTDCTPGPEAGNGSGVTANSSYSGISVRNGSVTGMGRYGVFINGQQAKVEGIRARWNGFEGIFTDTGSLVRNNVSYQNGQVGIRAGGGSLIVNNVAYQNGTSGVTGTHGTSLINNTAYLNGSNGISGSEGSTITGNTSFENGGDGIYTGIGSLVQSNTVRGNTMFGLNLGANSGYRENVITGNGDGTVTGGVNLGTNLCETNTTCP